MRAMADVLITEYTDPACPWAYSAEPFRHRLNWLYGDRLEWQVRMVVLSESTADMEASGFDTAKLSSAYRTIAHDHGMPIDTALRPRMAASLPACRAVVAARLHAPASTRAVLRSLRVRNFAGELLDDPQTIAGAALDAGLDAEALAVWAAGEDVSAAIAEDKALARAPMPAARTLDYKLANWSGGRRYTCPSYEILRRSDDVRIAVPGFQPFTVYDVILANLVPDLERSAVPGNVEEVLRWARTPLASKEVAVLCGLEVWEAREALGRVATERHVGADGFWSL